MRTFSLKTYAPLLLTAVILLMPLVGLAQFDQGTTQVQRDQGTTQVQNQSAGKLENPLKNANNFCDLIKIVLQAILVIGLPIAVVFLVYVGFKFITAQGNPEKIKEAQKNFLNTAIGIAIFLGAWTIAQVIAATLRGLGASGVNECR